MTAREDREYVDTLEEENEQLRELLEELVHSIHDADTVGEIDTLAAETFLGME